MTAFLSQQTSVQLRPHLAERLHQSDGEVVWNDREGRTVAIPALPCLRSIYTEMG
jgi:hypothetical protein